MSAPTNDGGVHSVYNFWLGLIPQFFDQFGAGAAKGGDAAAAAGSGLSYPADQIARAATMTQHVLQSLANTYMPMLHTAGAPGLLGQWAAAMPLFAGVAPAAAPAATNPFGPWAAMMPFAGGASGAAANPAAAAAGASPASSAQAMMAPWAAMMPFMPGMQPKADVPPPAAQGAAAMFNPWAAAMPFLGAAQPQPAGAPPAGANAAGMFAPWLAAMGGPQGQPGSGASASGAGISGALPFQSMQQAWVDMAKGMVGGSPQGFMTGFERTFGGLSDALGLGPARKLQAAYQDLLAASMAQNESRANYALLVQRAFATGFEGLMQRLAEMAEKGERVDSVLALLRLWAVSTEQAVHQVLQSEPGMVATAALARAGITYRRRLQHVAGIVADSLDMATRRELDEAFREIQDLKRQLRALRPAVTITAAPAKPAARNAKRKPNA